MKITYEPIEEVKEPFTEAELYDFCVKILSLYEPHKQPEKIIQIDQES